MPSYRRGAAKDRHDDRYRSAAAVNGMEHKRFFMQGQLTSEIVIYWPRAGPFFLKALGLVLNCALA